MPAVVLISYPIVAIALFAALGPARGLIWTAVVGYLFLPEGYEFNLPLVEYDKGTAIVFSALLATIIIRARKSADDPPERLADPVLLKSLLVLLGVYLLVPIGTFLTNSETLVNGEIIRPALSPRDFLADSIGNLIRVAPFLLAWRFMRSPENQRHLLVAMVSMGVVYSFLALFELRMSPQLNNWVYGYFPHSWLQHIRGGGYRPVVFLRHGLWLGMFLLSTVIAAIALARTRDDKALAGVYWLLGIWLFLVLALSRNMGALLLGVLFVPMLIVLTVRAQFRVAAVVSVLFLAYPMLQSALQVQIDGFIEVMQGVSPERAASMATRVNNENMLLERGMEKPLFGWGGWGRMRILDETGRDVSLVDGAWIVAFGYSGWLGYLSYFGLLVLPILMMGRALKRKPASPVIAGMAVMSAANLLYLIPNSALSTIGMLVFGTIAAYAIYDPVEVKADSDPMQEPERKTRYSRFAPQPASSASGSRPQRPAVSTRYSSRSRSRSGA